MICSVMHGLYFSFSLSLMYVVIIEENDFNEWSKNELKAVTVYWVLAAATDCCGLYCMCECSVVKFALHDCEFAL